MAVDNVKQMDSALGALIYAALQENATKPPATYQSVARAIELAVLNDGDTVLRALGFTWVATDYAGTIGYWTNDPFKRGAKV